MKTNFLSKTMCVSVALIFSSPAFAKGIPAYNINCSAKINGALIQLKADSPNSFRGAKDGMNVNLNVTRNHNDQILVGATVDIEDQDLLSQTAPTPVEQTGVGPFLARFDFGNYGTISIFCKKN